MARDANGEVWVERGGQLDSYDTDSLIGVLEQLARVYAGHKVVLLCDGLSAHWSQKMRAHLEQQRDWLTVERLPAYAPELNVVEYLWANCGPGAGSGETTPAGLTCCARGARLGRSLL